VVQPQQVASTITSVQLNFREVHCRQLTHLRADTCMPCLVWMRKENRSAQKALSDMRWTRQPLYCLGRERTLTFLVDDDVVCICIHVVHCRGNEAVASAYPVHQSTVRTHLVVEALQLADGYDMRAGLCCAGPASGETRSADASSGLFQHLEPLSDGLRDPDVHHPAQHKPRPAA
jgi:hypothetical protein